MDYVFMTDSDSDLPFHFKEEYNIPVVYMPYALNGKEYFDDLGQTLDYRSYYNLMREGAVPITSALNEPTYLEYFEPILKEKDLLFVAFSSQLSSTIQSVYSAREKLLKKYPERKFVVVDTLSIGFPMTLLVLKAHAMYRAGKPIGEVASWLETNKLRAHGWFTVDDLKYLRRGGRVSATAATVGTMLDLKPILTETAEGKLAAADKVRGRKKAINTLADKLTEYMPDPAESELWIVHADCVEEAEKLKAMLEQKYPGFTVRIEQIGPVIGAHTGPGTVGLCWIGKKRTI